MRRGLVYAVAAVTLLALLASCAAPAPTTAPAPAPTTAPAPAKPLVLKGSDNGAKGRVFSYLYAWWSDEISKRTGGKVQVEWYYNEALGPQKEQVDNLGAHLFDIALIIPGVAPGKLPLYSAISTMPFLTGDATAHAKGMAEISELPEMQNEMKQQKIKYLFSPSSPAAEYEGNKPVRKIEDFKGLRVRTLDLQGVACAKLGMVPVGIPLTDLYTALERGTVDGMIYAIMAVEAYKLDEVCKYVTIFGGISTSAQVIAINLDVWNNLSPDIQKLMIDIGKEAMDKQDELNRKTTDEALSRYLKKGMQAFYLTPQEIAQMRNIGGQPIWDGWTAEMEAKGIPGKKLFSALQAAVKKYEK